MDYCNRIMRLVTFIGGKSDKLIYSTVAYGLYLYISLYILFYAYYSP